MENQDEERAPAGALVLFVVAYGLFGYFILPSFVDSYSRLGPWWLTVPLATSVVLAIVSAPLRGRLTLVVDGILGVVLFVTLAGLWIAVNWKAPLKGIGYALGWAIVARYSIAILVAVVALTRRKGFPLSGLSLPANGTTRSMKDPKPTFLELLLGRTVDVELPGKSGRRKVSKKWFDTMIAEGQIQPANTRDSEPPAVSNAKLLVRLARLGPIGFLVPLLDRFPQLTQAKPEDWDFFLGVGSVCAGLAQHDVSNPPEWNKVVRRLVAQELVEWHANALDALEDCEEFVTRTMDALLKNSDGEWSDALSKSIGYWVFWNVLRHRPTGDADLELASVVGALALRTVEGCWDREEKT